MIIPMIIWEIAVMATEAMVAATVGAYVGSSVAKAIDKASKECKT
jgi:hypothetical protein